MKTLVTVSQNKLGHLHIFLGEVWVNTNNPLCHTSDGKASEIYLQSYDDIKLFIQQLSKQKRKELSEGYQITAKIDSELIDCLTPEF